MTLPLPDPPSPNEDKIAQQFPIQPQNFAGIRVIAATVTDAYWQTPPPIGTLALDSADNRLYVKTAAATWKYTALT